MQLKDIYIVMYVLLNNLYDTFPDSLASILSDMDPNLFEDRKPADPAIYEDWINATKLYFENEVITNCTIFMALESFLEFYQKEYGYQLNDVLQYLKQNSKTALEEINQLLDAQGDGSVVH